MTADLRELAIALIEALPKCDLCKTAPATRARGRGGARYCDACAARDAYSVFRAVPEYPRAAPLRALMAALEVVSPPPPWLKGPR